MWLSPLGVHLKMYTNFMRFFCENEKNRFSFYFVSDNLMMVWEWRCCGWLWMRKLNVSSHKPKTIKFTLNRKFQQSLKCQCQSRFINLAKMLKILCSFYLEFIILPKNEQIILHSKSESFTATKRKHVQRYTSTMTTTTATPNTVKRKTINQKGNNSFSLNPSNQPLLNHHEFSPRLMLHFPAKNPQMMCCSLYSLLDSFVSFISL